MCQAALFTRTPIYGFAKRIHYTLVLVAQMRHIHVYTTTTIYLAYSRSFYLVPSTLPYYKRDRYRMIMRRHVQRPSILLCLLGACTGFQTEDPPATVQFDLVFPPPHSLIEPYYPSPVIFAVHNFSAIGDNTLFWNWNITDAINTVKGYESITVVASGQSRPDTIGVELLPDVLLIIEPVSQLWNNTMDLLRLSYTFGLTYACGNTTGLSTTGSNDTVQFKGESFFALLPIHQDGDYGPLALARKGRCGRPIGSIGVQKQPWSNSEQECQVINPGMQPAKTCALPIDARVTRWAESVMNIAAECPNRTWPDTIGLMGNCMSRASGKNDLETRGMILFISAAFLLIVIYP